MFMISVGFFEYKASRARGRRGLVARSPKVWLWWGEMQINTGPAKPALGPRRAVKRQEGHPEAAAAALSTRVGVT